MKIKTISMTPEAQRIAIAEAVPAIKCDGLEDWYYLRDGVPYDCLNNDPLQDLNAMHEAEKSLTLDQRMSYQNNWLPRVLLNSEGNHWLVSATATQRAEAFLRTLSLWRE